MNLSDKFKDGDEVMFIRRPRFNGKDYSEDRAEVQGWEKHTLVVDLRPYRNDQYPEVDSEHTLVRRLDLTRTSVVYVMVEDLVLADASEEEVAEAIASIQRSATHAPPASWRDNRGPGWTKDIGYALQDVVRAHRYDYRASTSKPDDPGWNACSCGWEGYWSSFEPHVADALREVVVDHNVTRTRDASGRDA